MQSPPPNYPPQRRSSGFYAAWACGGGACLSVIAVVVSVYLLGQGMKKGFESMAAQAREAQVDLKVQDHKLVKKQDERAIEGSLKNISPAHTYETASVEFYLYDKNGKQLPSASAETENLKPGATWKFKAPITDPNAESYKFREVTGFQDVTEDPNLDPHTRQKMKAERAEMKQRIQELLQKAKEDSAKPGKP